jgi:hypothetical protein
MRGVGRMTRENVLVTPFTRWDATLLATLVG